MQTIKVGQDARNDIVISNDPNVSGTHCEFIKDDDGNFWVVDKDPQNGTFVNDERTLGKTQLKDNDSVRIGNSTLPWKNYFSAEPAAAPVPQKSEEKKSRKLWWIWLIIILAILLTLGAGGFVYWNYFYNSEPETAIADSLENVLDDILIESQDDQNDMSADEQKQNNNDTKKNNKNNKKDNSKQQQANTPDETNNQPPTVEVAKKPKTEAEKIQELDETFEALLFKHKNTTTNDVQWKNITTNLGYKVRINKTSWAVVKERYYEKTTSREKEHIINVIKAEFKD